MSAKDRLERDAALLSPTHTVEEISRRFRHLTRRSKELDRRLRPTNVERTIRINADSTRHHRP